jgi:hypothetical protein
MYRIKSGQRVAAKKLGVAIRPSISPGKKIDVFKHGIKIASIGDVEYSDFWTYVQDEKAGRVAKGTAEERRRLYRVRHAQECVAQGTPGYYACKILW